MIRLVNFNLLHELLFCCPNLQSGLKVINIGLLLEEKVPKADEEKIPKRMKNEYPGGPFSLLLHHDRQHVPVGTQAPL